METQLTRRLVMPALAAAALAGAAAVDTKRGALAETASHQMNGRVISLAREYLARLGALDRPINVTGESIEVPSGRGKLRRLWSVECRDVAGGYAGIVIMDEQTGRVVGASFVPRGRTSGASLLPNERAATEAANAAVRAAFPERGRDAMALAGRPESNREQWYVDIRSPRASGALALEAATGQLVSLRVKYKSDAPRMIARR